MNCSGRGILLENGECQCFRDWSSTGDLRAQSGLDCDVSVVFVRVFYGIPSIMLIGIIMFASRELVFLLSRKSLRKLLERGRTSKAFILQANTILLSCVFLSMYTLKMVHPSLAMGVDDSITWLFATGLMLLVINLIVAFDLMITFSLLQERFAGDHSFAQLLQFTKCCMPAVLFVLFAACFLVVGAVYARRQSVALADSLIQAGLLVAGTFSICMAIGAPVSVRTAIRDLDAMARRRWDDDAGATTEKEIAGLAHTLRMIRLNISFLGFFNGACFYIMGLVSEVRYWSPYLVGVMTLLLPFAIFRISALTATQSNKGSSSTQGSKTIPRINSKVVSHDSKDGITTKRSSKDNDEIAISSHGSMIFASSPKSDNAEFSYCIS